MKTKNIVITLLLVTSVIIGGLVGDRRSSEASSVSQKVRIGNLPLMQ